jgi:hypothetical protein
MTKDDCPLTFGEARERLIETTRSLYEKYPKIKHFIKKEIEICEECMYFRGSDLISSKCAVKWNYFISCCATVFYSNHKGGISQVCEFVKKELYDVYEEIFGKEEPSKKEEMMTSLRYYIETLNSQSEDGKRAPATQFDFYCLARMIYEILEEK